MIAIAPTDAEAEAVARAGAEWTIASYARAPATPADASAAVERYVKDVAIHGSPERVIDQIQSLRERIGLDYLMCAPLSHESFMLFTDKVLPKLL